MKKFRVLTPILIAICFCVIAGFTTIPVVRNFVADDNKTAEQSKENEQTDNTKNESTNFKITESEEVILSAEDKAVKAEIVKYADTKVDFTHIKQEKIENKTYDIEFSRVDSNSDKKHVIYKNKAEDEFKYDINSGKLYYANIKSVRTEKNDNSIDMATAEKLAYSYASSNCNISEYVLDWSNEGDDRYEFSYRRYIGKYKTSDVFIVDVSFDGEITYVINNTHLFDAIDISQISINEEWLDLKVTEMLNNLKPSESFDENSVIITWKDEKLQLMFHIKKVNTVGVQYIPME